ncbi:MAG: rRNA maturation RNase YbeY [Armatimonadetes bacterium]|nr:rRNA maturation RNase YbeY [Armatimonadota bacterium]MDE2207946.1 rRNA maturation RNase YbeY [Armatimonadota bacterium]
MERRPATAELNVVLTSDRRVHALNLLYRGIDAPTDVLSFSQIEGETPIEVDPNLLGDVVIAVPTAARQAAVRGGQLQAEVELLTAHGVLHLLGYEDDTERGVRRMWKKQREALKLLYR